MKRFNTLLLAVLFIFSCNKKNLSGDIRPFDAPYVSINYPENVIIPAPKLISREQHVFFAFSDKTKIFTDTKELKPLVQREFADKYGLKVKNNNSIEIPNSIFFSISNSIEQEEGYKIKISKKQVLISAKTQKGIFYAIQSLNFIFPKKLQQHPSSIPAVTIEDFPEFSYRGMHLDVARHFFPVSFIKKYIDYLARYKYNYFHWHLTEDQGWRIEIKKYPKLQEIAAYRDETLIGHYSNKPHQFDGKKYGGFYTQEEIKEIVAYAENKQITIIPEIEMPGHAQAALAAYPELGCGKDEYKVATKWGIFEDVYCPTETTFKFLEDVIDEVIELFPSKYIHIGGDE